MRQVVVRGGAAIVERTPAPEVMPGRVLVRTRASAISVGTELGSLKAQNDPLWRRALRNPDKVVRAIRMMSERGIGQTLRVVKDVKSTGVAAGYSAAGEVIGIGAGVTGFNNGDRVACAGAGYAMHADFISVPENLVVPIPGDLSMKAASTVTLGAIALQGVRRLQPTLGEVFVVFGLGILGQIAVQLLKVNGCRVIGVDIDSDRIDRAMAFGADFGLDNANSIPVESIHRLTGGAGADGVVVTAAADDPTLLNTAFAMCRRKGRVVLVGDVPITIDRDAVYRHELEFLISTSYGPGRYDASYEEHGLDYPIAYVRWTETRNMQAYLDLLAAGRVNVDDLIDVEVPVDEAPSAYRLLAAPEGPRPLAAVLNFGGDNEPPVRKVETGHRHIGGSSQRIDVALVGASGFARSVHLPNMEALEGKLRLAAVCSNTGHQAKALAIAHRADYVTTNLQEVLHDAEIGLVLIAGRHNGHARQALAALQAGKHVLTEKPLALNENELSAIEQFYAGAGAGAPVLMTGFNRRFAPGIEAIRKRLAKRIGPLVLSYRMNAGYVPQSHWTQQAEGGGRNIGEACHIYDLCTALTGSRVAHISASAIGREDARSLRNENFSASITFEDGSLANVVYTSLGASNWPKERMEIYCDGEVYLLDDYNAAFASGGKRPLWKGKQDKGHRQELAALTAALVDGGDWPIPLWQQLQATRISFEVERRIHDQTRHHEGK